MTLVVDPARMVEACTHLRDTEGFNLLVDIAGYDYLGWGTKSGGIHRHAGRTRPQRGRIAGLPAVPEPKLKRFAIINDLLRVSDCPSGCA